TVTRMRVSSAVRVTPKQFTAASAATASTATGRSAPAGAAYAAKVIAIAAQLASLPMTKHQPATKPHHGPISARAYAYVPPATGCTAASCADAVALQNATTAAIASATNNPDPATSTAGPQTAKTPAPI